MPDTPPTASLSDEQIDDIARREIGWSFFGAGMELLDVLELGCKKVSPTTDPLPDERLTYANATDPHVLITARCLALNNDELVVTTDYFLYTLDHLAEAGEGPSPTPDSYIDVAWKTVNLHATLAADVREVLVRLMIEDPPSDELATLLASQEHPEAFVAAIKDETVRHAFARLWEKQRRCYE